jgi:23S rRNA (guanosine2251-2'-O)-methyltransferase
VISEIKQLAASRNIEIRTHSKKNLSHISRNARQDQGIAIDLIAPQYRNLAHLIKSDLQPGAEYILVDRITNPQNLGMIIRSVAASPLAGLILPTQGCATIDPLVYKASAGCLLKTNIYRCQSSLEGALALQQKGYQLIGLSAQGRLRLNELDHDTPKIMMLGNESKGLSAELQDACDQLLGIPMANTVDSLNVAVTAGIIAFHRIR